MSLEAGVSEVGEEAHRQNEGGVGSPPRYLGDKAQDLHKKGLNCALISVRQLFVIISEQDKDHLGGNVMFISSAKCYRQYF